VQIRLVGIWVKFVHEGQWVKVKVTGAKNTYIFILSMYKFDQQ